MAPEGIRAVFVDSLDRTRPLLDSPELRAGWDRPSLLAELSVAGLAGHLVRAAVSVEGYLEATEPDADPIGPSEYYRTLALSSDPDDAMNRGIRTRGIEAAADGHGALIDAFDRSVAHLTRRLGSEPADRRVAVVAGLVLTLDGYLVTRLVELVVHADDLAQSLGITTPSYTAAAHETVRTCLIGVGVARYGDLGVLRSLTRRERDNDEALRVF